MRYTVQMFKFLNSPVIGDAEREGLISHLNEEEFLSKLDEMVEQAFDDQCTGANPRYPLIAEMKDMYLRAFYGADYKA